MIILHRPLRIFPVEEIVKRAHTAGIIIIDGALAPGQLSLHFDSLDADFYGGNLHKVYKAFCHSLIKIYWESP